MPLIIAPTSFFSYTNNQSSKHGLLFISKSSFNDSIVTTFFLVLIKTDASDGDIMLSGPLMQQALALSVFCVMYCPAPLPLFKQVDCIVFALTSVGSQR